MGYTQLVKYYRENPSRMSTGAGPISKRFGISREDVARARMEARMFAPRERDQSREGDGIAKLAAENKIDLGRYECNAFWQIEKEGVSSISAHFRKKEIEQDLKAQKEVLLEELKDIRTADFEQQMCFDAFCSGDKLLEVCAFDLHLGKLAWDKESGEDYCIEIACKRYEDAITDLLSQINLSQIGKILLPVGNDMLNVDSKANTTTAGTPQTSDSRFGKMVKVLKNLLISTIDRLSMIAPVDVVVIPGNHDEHTMFLVGEILEAFYHNTDRVVVYNSPKSRKYYEFGKCMIMYTHGNGEKHGDLGLICATEEPQMWGRTKYREAHLGHYHKSKSTSYINVDENQGFRVRILPSLSANDAWHYGKGYSAIRAAEAFVWDKEKGLRQNIYHNL
jgi:hypothetical protein